MRDEALNAVKAMFYIMVTSVSLVVGVQFCESAHQKDLHDERVAVAEETMVNLLERLVSLQGGGHVRRFHQDHTP